MEAAIAVAAEDSAVKVSSPSEVGVGEDSLEASFSSSAFSRNSIASESTRSDQAFVTQRSQTRKEATVFQMLEVSDAN